jgi:AcrR family transcriptional regulator
MAASGKRANSGRTRRDRSEEVLETAIAVFYEKGYPKASIQDVADRVGVLKGSLYHYIESKEDLLFEVFAGSDEQWAHMMSDVGKLEMPPTERLGSFVHEWCLWYLNNLKRASVYASEWHHLRGKRLESVKTKRREYERFVIEMIDEVKAAGDAHPNLDSRYACFLIFSAINGLTTWYRRRGKDSAEHIANVYQDMILGMIRCSPGRVRPAVAKKGQKRKS